MKRLNLPKEETFDAPASLWKRIAAFLLDMLILNLFVLFPFHALFEMNLPADYSFSDALSLMSNTEYAKEMTMIATFMSLMIMLYFYVLEKKFGQSIGKHLLHLHVISEKNNPKNWQFLARNIYLLPIFPFFLLWILDPLFMLFNKTGQRLSEILSKTKVIEKHNLNGW